MHAVTLHTPGPGGTLKPTEIPAPEAGRCEVLIDVAYAGVNRADLLQMRGKYPMPAGVHAVPGLEVSGTVSLSHDARFKEGDRVCALVSQGGYAECVAVDADHVLPVPEGCSLAQAGALMEACFTVWASLAWQARLTSGETALIHGGASGIGTMAIQVARYLGARVFATAGTKEKCDVCERLGVQKAILYPQEDFVTAVKTATEGTGADVILDMVGGDYFGRNLEALAQGGRLAVIAFLKGAKTEVNLGPILLKHLQITGSTLRSRSAGEKAFLARDVGANLWPGVKSGAIMPVIDRVFALNEAEKALLRMDQGLNIGKILLKI